MLIADNAATEFNAELLFLLLYAALFRGHHSRSFASLSLAITHSSLILFFSSCRHPLSNAFTVHLLRSSNHLNFGSVTLSPNRLIWAVFLIYSFLILSIHPGHSQQKSKNLQLCHLQLCLLFLAALPSPHHISYIYIYLQPSCKPPLLLLLLLSVINPPWHSVHTVYSPFHPPLSQLYTDSVAFIPPPPPLQSLIHLHPTLTASHNVICEHHSPRESFSVNLSIITGNKTGSWVTPWCNPTPTLKPSVSPYLPLLAFYSMIFLLVLYKSELNIL